MNAICSICICAYKLHLHLFVAVVFGFYCLFFLRKSFSIALYTVLKVALVDQAGLEPKEIHLPLPSEC